MSDIGLTGLLRRKKEINKGIRHLYSINSYNHVQAVVIRNNKLMIRFYGAMIYVFTIPSLIPVVSKLFKNFSSISSSVASPFKYLGFLFTL